MYFEAMLYTRYIPGMRDKGNCLMEKQIFLQVVSFFYFKKENFSIPFYESLIYYDKKELRENHSAKI